MHPGPDRSQTVALVNELLTHGRTCAKTAHNPKVGGAMTTIVPQLPFIITAYEELAALL